MINGFLMFFIFQGDKFIIGIYYNMEKVAVYSTAFMLTMTPALLIIKVLTSLILPLFSKKQDDMQLLNTNYLLAIDITVLIISAYTVFFTLYGDIFLGFVFGKHYQNQANLMMILGVLWSLRILRAPSTLLAMSKGYNKVGLIANIFRSIVLFCVIYFAKNQYPIEFIAYAGCLGELIAVFVTVNQIKSKILGNYTLFFKRIPLFLFSFATSGLYVFYCQFDVISVSIITILFLILFLLIAISIYNSLIFKYS